MKLSVSRATLSSDAIEAMLVAALARARKLDAHVHIAILDSGAVLAGCINCDGAPRISSTIAVRKAYTAVTTGRTTEQWEAFVNSLPANELKIIDSLGSCIAAKGGYPVIENGLVLGGIGVSGASQNIDAEIALAGIRAVTPAD